MDACNFTSSPVHSSEKSQLEKQESKNSGKFCVQAKQYYHGCKENKGKTFGSSAEIVANIRLNRKVQLQNGLCSNHNSIHTVFISHFQHTFYIASKNGFCPAVKGRFTPIPVHSSMISCWNALDRILNSSLPFEAGGGMVVQWHRNHNQSPRSFPSHHRNTGNSSTGVILYSEMLP